MKALRFVFGSIAVYLSVATLHACSAAAPNFAASAAGPGGGGASSSGHGGTSSSGHGGAIAQGSGTGGFMSSAGGAMVSTTGDIFDSGIFDAITDPVSNASADPVSGSRLKAYYQTSDDGGKAYIAGSWYDSQRDEDCISVFASDGQRRCVPLLGAASFTHYMDAQCTVPVARESSNGCYPKYVYTYTPPSTCNVAEGRYGFRPVLAPIAPAQVYYLGGSGCGVASVPLTGWHLVGAEIPPSSFVAMSYQHD